MKPIVIFTVDVEPDNCWQSPLGTGFESAHGLRRFHRLCSQYGVRPTYLVTHSVAENRPYRLALLEMLRTGECEIGAHPHLWEIPPQHPLDGEKRCATEYPEAVLEAKLDALLRLLREEFGPVVSHRAGRWGFSAAHHRVLERLGIRYDTSITPGIDWRKSRGPDYRFASAKPHFIGEVIEVPCSIRRSWLPTWLIRPDSFNRKILGVKLTPEWLRLRRNSSNELMKSISKWAWARQGFANMMTHSSEMIAGASPYWPSEDSIAKVFRCYEQLFTFWRASGAEGLTLGEYGDRQRAGA
ncbi:MAG: hypothetical protein EPN33_06470 [Acidobacteria bacterium]|nr:MAG: hypothetical protein EPN33_06470 [Acidobacteriota bacterium]